MEAAREWTQANLSLDYGSTAVVQGGRMEQEQEVELVFRRVRVVTESGEVVWIEVESNESLDVGNQDAA